LYLFCFFNEKNTTGGIFGIFIYFVSLMKKNTTRGIFLGSINKIQGYL